MRAGGNADVRADRFDDAVANDDGAAIDGRFGDREDLGVGDRHDAASGGARAYASGRGRLERDGFSRAVALGSWFDRLTPSGIRTPLALSLSSLDFARDDPELVEGSKGEVVVGIRPAGRRTRVARRAGFGRRRTAPLAALGVDQRLLFLGELGLVLRIVLPVVVALPVDVDAIDDRVAC